MRHRKLDMLPAMKCDAGCGACCGPAPASEAEYQKVLHVARSKGIVPKRQGVTCPFFQGGTCQVYDARPFACRLFGHVEGMTCERGHNVNITPRDEYRLRLRHGDPKRVLHEALVDMGIVKTLEEALDPVPVLVPEPVDAAAFSEVT
ncbi:MAG: YkgJ family cysteine cluster protein [Polyangiales bacterium]